MLIYLSEKSAANPQNLKDAGLEMLLRDDDDQPIFGDLEGAGPDGKMGQLVSWHRPGQRVGYFPDDQIWKESPPDLVRDLPRGAYWIGWEKTALPGPNSLARNTLMDGYQMTLGDGRDWIVPNAMQVPHRFYIDDDGKSNRKPLKRWEAFYEKAMSAARLVVEDWKAGGGVLTWEKTFDYCIEVLSLSYRINPWIAGEFQLLNEDNIGNVMAKTTDMERLLVIQDTLKKNSPAAIPSG